MYLINLFFKMIKLIIGLTLNYSVALVEELRNSLYLSHQLVIVRVVTNALLLFAYYNKLCIAMIN